MGILSHASLILSYAFEMPRDEEPYVPDHLLLFANEHFSFSVQRFIRTGSTDGWYFFDAGKNIGTLIAIREQHPPHCYVHGSFTVAPDPDLFWPYIIAFLTSIGIHSAFVSVHTGGTDAICSSFEE